MSDIEKDLGRLCRTCMSKHQNFASIYDEVKNSLRVCDILGTIAPQLTIMSSDKLPSVMCASCLDDLKKAYKFQQMCIASENYMLNMLHSDFSKGDSEDHHESETSQAAIIECSMDAEEFVENCVKMETYDQELKEFDFEALYLEAQADKESIEDEFSDPSSDSNISDSSEYKEKRLNKTSRKKQHPLINTDNEMSPQDEKSNNSSYEDYECPDCSRQFESRKSLTAHLRCHRKTKGNQSLKCDFCPKKFRKVSIFTKHLLTHPENQSKDSSLGRNKKPHVCKDCNKAFKYSFSLKEHQRIHTGQNAFLCPVCGKSFMRSSNMRQHFLRHGDEKRFQCPECPSKFPCRSDIIKHMATHKAIKPHVCDICGSRFTRIDTLNKHKFIHTGERPHKCDECSMTFVFIGPLQRHMRTHTGEKPYKCTYCEKSYSASGDLNKHLRIHVGKNTYMCKECPEKFKYFKELRVHQALHFKSSQQKDKITKNNKVKADLLES